MIFSKNNYRHWLALTYIAIFIVLEYLVVSHNAWLAGLDNGIQNAIKLMNNGSYTSIFTVITFLGSPPIIILLTVFIVFWLFSIGKKVESIWTFCTLMAGDAIAFLIKITVKRPRPTDKVIPDSGYSFPSGHVFGTTLLVLFIIYLVLPYFKNQEVQFLLCAIAISWLAVLIFSRLYLRGHFTSDTIGSVLLAASWWEFSQLLYLKYYDLTSRIINKLPVLRNSQN
ncbi:phosphatase PAP2 family protein [Companilactobacillus keshanensis]|uniref:Phosphatase PAP2 family protein n=1 Tax=Companilactobacillus keshanensis TaxID=2486003 RepID=A0ABW4BVK3_9LACO|nr:phosphatase PAP2 family protein [Companilactobacillus keshanensis]